MQPHQRTARARAEVCFAPKSRHSSVGFDVRFVSTEDVNKSSAQKSPARSRGFEFVREETHTKITPCRNPRRQQFSGSQLNLAVCCKKDPWHRPHKLIRPDVADGSWLRDNADEPTMRRIVFSIAFSRKRPPVQLLFTSTKSRQNFYAQVQLQSFHAARVKRRSGEPCVPCPLSG